MPAQKVKKVIKLPVTLGKELDSFFGQAMDRNKALKQENAQLVLGIRALNSNIEHKVCCSIFNNHALFE